MVIKRTKILRVRLSFIEHATIKRKATESGRNLSRFVREVALGYDVKPKRFSEEQKMLYRTLAGMANNLNQVAKRYNSGHFMQAELSRLVGEIKLVVEKILSDGR
jgi:hypothetical protein